MRLNNCPICGHTPMIQAINPIKLFIHCSNKQCPLTREVPIFTTDTCTKTGRNFEEVCEYLCDIWNDETAKINELILHR